MNEKVTCRDCRRRVPADSVEVVSRMGGGTYRRASRWRDGQTCVNCIEGTLLYMRVREGKADTSVTTDRYSTRSLLQALSRLIARGHSDLDEHRWRAKFPDNRFETFEEYFTALRDGVERCGTGRR